MAKRPGGSSEPDIIAARVSSTACLVFSTTASGRLRVAASLIYVARVEVMSAAEAERKPPVIPTRLRPAPNLKRSRRERLFAILVILCEIVADHHSALHDEFDAFHFCDIAQRVTGYSDDIGKFSFLDGAE